jgi:HK97 family phage portal protein
MRVIPTLQSWGRKLLGVKGPTDDFWYSPTAGATLSGEPMSEEIAATISAVYRCWALLSEGSAMLPAMVYRELERGMERVPGHWLRARLRDSPNPYQTGFQFRRQLVTNLCATGNSYIELRGNPVEPEFWPIHPARVQKVELLPSGRVRFGVRDIGTGIEKPMIGGVDIVHVYGLTLDGLTGCSPIRYARETLGLTRALEKHGARQFGQGVRFAGVLTYPKELKPATKIALEESFGKEFAGASGQHRVPILEDGMDWKTAGMANDDAQFLESRQFQLGEISRWYGVPSHMIYDTERTTSWGSGVEVMSTQFVTYGLQPIVTNLEGVLRKHFLPPGHSVKFNVGALLRADTETRFTRIYPMAISSGVLSPNECRELEDLSPREGGDVWLTPLNMREAGSDAVPPARRERKQIAPAEENQQ